MEDAYHHHAAGILLLIVGELLNKRPERSCINIVRRVSEVWHLIHPSIYLLVPIVIEAQGMNLKPLSIPSGSCGWLSQAFSSFIHVEKRSAEKGK